jgi:hypothetical protein
VSPECQSALTTEKPIFRQMVAQADAGNVRTGDHLLGFIPDKHGDVT